MQLRLGGDSKLPVGHAMSHQERFTRDQVLQQLFYWRQSSEQAEDQDEDDEEDEEEDEKEDEEDTDDWSLTRVPRRTRRPASATV
ncbi:unnamed protein product [Pleuronectes platessa]|uniref:Uncharacterized protein n=1 Tax=Pleuronectes platessa TaxID=8262 RepID=A0A9N7Y4V7_PLEPL|nr:unnamed protein product [Pleuronectes platessa]